MASAGWGCNVFNMDLMVVFGLSYVFRPVAGNAPGRGRLMFAAVTAESCRWSWAHWR